MYLGRHLSFLPTAQCLLPYFGLCSLRIPANFLQSLYTSRDRPQCQNTEISCRHHPLVSSGHLIISKNHMIYDFQKSRQYLQKSEIFYLTIQRFTFLGTKVAAYSLKTFRLFLKKSSDFFEKTIWLFHLIFFSFYGLQYYFLQIRPLHKKLLLSYPMAKTSIV